MSEATRSKTRRAPKRSLPSEEEISPERRRTKRSKRLRTISPPPSPPLPEEEEEEETEEIPVAPPSRKRSRAEIVSTSTNISTIEPPAKRGPVWVTPSVDAEPFKQAVLTYDDDDWPTVNWWDPEKRYPRTMRELVDSEEKYLMASPQTSQWKQVRKIDKIQPLSSDMLDLWLKESDIRDSDIPATPKYSAIHRVSMRIQHLAMRQIQARKEITDARNRLEKHSRGESQRAELPPVQESSRTTPSSPVLDEEERHNNLVEAVLNFVRDGVPFTEFLLSPVDGPSDTLAEKRESDMVHTRTAIDETRRIFSKGYVPVSPIDFLIQMRMPSSVTREEMKSLLEDRRIRGFSDNFVGIDGDYRLVVDMKKAPHDAAYLYAASNSNRTIRQSTRQWFFTLNYNKTTKDLWEEQGKPPERVAEETLALLSAFDPILVKYATGMGEYPISPGAIRRWQILYHANEIGPRTGFYHMHFVLSCTFIHFSPCTMRMDYRGLRTSLQSLISDGIYFHATAIKKPFALDGSLPGEEEKRLKAYIEKGMESIEQVPENQK